MKKIILVFSLFLLTGFLSLSWAQLSIDECQKKARENYPLIKRYELIDKSKEYNLSNAGKGYLPQVSMSAKATYQSEVTKIPISVPGIDIKGLSKDQYGATIDVNQTIWNGGAISSRKDVTKTAADVEHKQLDVDLYTINDRVNQMFFGILLLDAKLKQNELLQDELQRNHNLISSYIQYGVANQADLDAVRVEQLNAKQNQVQLEANRRAYIQMLGTLIGESLNESTILLKPNAETLSLANQSKRPELDLYDAQINNLEAQKKSIKSNYMPKLGLFVTGGYGKPGLNMLESDFSAYYIGGIKLSWNFGSLYTQKNEKRLIEANQSSVMVQRETFLFNTSMEVLQENNEITKNRDLLKYDDEIITLRGNVKKAAEAKVANGTMTVTDLMREVTNEDLAKQDKIQHEVELLLSIYNLKFTTNN